MQRGLQIRGVGQQLLLGELLLPQHLAYPSQGHKVKGRLTQVDANASICMLMILLSRLVPADQGGEASGGPPHERRWVQSEATGALKNVARPGHSHHDIRLLSLIRPAGCFRLLAPNPQYFNKDKSKSIAQRSTRPCA